MKFQRFETGVGLPPIDPPAGTADATFGQESSIEELPSAARLASSRHSDRWLGITIAICSAVVCLGFVSHAAAPVPVPASGSAFATPAMPSSSAPAEPTPSPTPTLSGPRVDRSAGTDGEGTPPVWQARVVADDQARKALLVDGDSPTAIRSLVIRLLTPAGHLVATYLAPVVMEDERPGSDGEARTQLGSFQRLIALPNQPWTRRFIVELTWHDAANGTSGSIRQPVPEAISPNG